MVDVQFEEEQNRVSLHANNGKSGIALWMVRKRIVKNVQQAHLILVVITVIFIAVALIITFAIGNDVPVPPESFT